VEHWIDAVVKRPDQSQASHRRDEPTTMASKAASDGAGCGEPPSPWRLIEAVLDEMRAGLRPDGGDLELQGISPDGVARVRLTGCLGCCPMAIATLQAALDNKVRDRVAGITGVVCVR
jgi:Fe-S cluster biogenesis protein NfuA